MPPKYTPADLGRYAAKQQNRAKEFLNKYRNDPAAIARRFKAIARGEGLQSIIKYNLFLSELNRVAGVNNILADLYNNANRGRGNNGIFWNTREWTMVNGPRRVYNLSALNKYKSFKAKAKAPKAPKAPKVNTGNLVAMMNALVVASPSRAPNNLVSLKLQAKKMKIRVTNNVNGKRVPKSANKLRTQIQNALARKR